MAGFGGLGANVDNSGPVRRFECRQGVVGHEVVVDQVLVQAGQKARVVAVLQAHAIVSAGVVYEAIEAAKLS